MLNTSYILSWAKKNSNANNEISEEKFMNFVGNLSEEEFTEVYSIILEHNFSIVSETVEAVPNYGVERKDMKKLTNEQLCVLYQRGEKVALDVLFEKNRRLILKIAYKMLKAYNPSGLEIDDLCSMGFMGLQKAAERYDVSTEYKFSTYACWWIKQAITREIMDTGYTIRIPVHVFEQVVKVKRLSNKLNGSSLEEIKNILNEEREKPYTIADIELLLNFGEKFLKLASLNRLVGNENSDTELMELLPDVFNVEDEVFKKLLLLDLIKVMKLVLTNKERAVLWMRFGLGGSEKMTLEAIGKKYNVSRERIRQIEVKALVKLRRSRWTRGLEDYYAA